MINSIFKFVNDVGRQVLAFVFGLQNILPQQLVGRQTAGVERYMLIFN